VKLTPKFEAITPRLPVSDVEKALTFYIDLLGFSLGWKWGDPLTHANVCRDSIALDLIATSPGRRGPALAYIRLSSVDAYFAELTARGVEVGELADRTYGMRDFEVVDPWGNRLAFGESRPQGAENALEINGRGDRI
jgi:catechol 2,3-dioxygenase-like lactoylglutathione lyase family enzyme